MESSIAEHLKCPRTRHRRVERRLRAAVPGLGRARVEPSVKQVVMGYFGVQSQGRRRCTAGPALRWRRSPQAFAATDGPGHHDLTHLRRRGRATTT